MPRGRSDQPCSGSSDVRSIAANQRLLPTTAVSTPAAMLTFTIKAATTSGSTMAPLIGIKATTVRITCASEPLGYSLLARVAVVFRCGALEIECDVPLLFAISGYSLNGVHLLTITEWHLNAEGAIT
jgi:hypothetical protein